MAPRLIGADTEGWLHAPYSLQFSSTPGQGFIIRAGDTVGLKHFRDWLYREKPAITLHSSLHDAPMLEVLAGINLWDFEVHDSLVMAYLLQLEPQGLKEGVLRHCGMPMQSYQDLMGDVADERARDYLCWLWDLVTLEYDERCQQEFEWQRSCGRRIKKVPKLPKTAFHKAVERCLASKSPRRLWFGQDDAITGEGVKRLGFLKEPSLDDTDPAAANRYACRDPDATLRYKAALWPKVQALGLEDVYTLELGTYPLIARMAKTGIKPNLTHFAWLSESLGLEIERLREDLIKQTGKPNFNANSGDHVADYLFGALGLEPMKLTRGGRGSTNDKVLEALERANPQYRIIGDIRTYRERYKLKHTFVDAMPAYVDRWPYDGRVHATFRTTRVVTGRLAAADPNLLAQPVHGDFAEEFRRGWIAESGHVLCEWDESQVELRVLAHLSQDPVMLAIYRGERRNPDGSKVDLHAALAERIFGVPPHQQNKSKHRLPAKAINFGLAMGMTSHGLMLELRKNGVDVDEEDAQRWLDDTMALYTGMPAYMQSRIDEARRNGFIRCLSGRIRYIGGIASPDEYTRAEAERFAFSTPIQEGASWLMKQCEIRVWRDVLPHFWKRGQWVEPILQIHDCLKLECEEGLEQELHPLMSHAMTQAPTGFSVPLEVEGEWGVNMADMTKFKGEHS